MKSKIKIILIIGAIVFISINAFNYFHNKNKASRDSLPISGTVEATEVRLSFQVGGKIKEILTDEGKFVKQGEILASLEKEELMTMKKQSESAYEEAKLNYERIEEDYSRAENLYKAGAVPQQQRDAVKTNFGVAKAKMETLQSSLDLTKLRLSYADLRSPLDSFILVKSAEVGEVIQPGAPVFTVIDLKNIWITGYINETDLGKVKLNQDANIRIDTYPDKTYKGRVSFISQEAEFTPKHIQTVEERTKLVYRVKINVDNSDFELKPGMPADAYIQIK
ncbi:MAG: efflux RND transporter periplasmic adaptor subunit [Candidatus Omnitrophica bacterium]|nr:efflux RND transporter periplasmic adaptor subunit [Candidatus Omnitrophota bacterium]